MCFEKPWALGVVKCDTASNATLLEFQRDTSEFVRATQMSRVRAQWGKGVGTGGGLEAVGNEA